MGKLIGENETSAPSVRVLSQCLITESVTEVGWHLWRLSSPTHLLKVGSSRAGCSEPCEVRF